MLLSPVTDALVKTLPKWISLPTQTQADQQKVKFFQKGGFPNVIGCVDCTHVRIQASVLQTQSVVCAAQPVLGYAFLQPHNSTHLRGRNVCRANTCICIELCIKRKNPVALLSLQRRVQSSLHNVGKSPDS